MDYNYYKFKCLLKASSLTISEFAEFLKCPLMDVEPWVKESINPPLYVFYKLMDYNRQQRRKIQDFIKGKNNLSFSDLAKYAYLSPSELRLLTGINLKLCDQLYKEVIPAQQDDIDKIIVHIKHRYKRVKNIIYSQRESPHLLELSNDKNIMIDYGLAIAFADTIDLLKF